MFGGTRMKFVLFLSLLSFLSSCVTLFMMFYILYASSAIPAFFGQMEKLL
jgi:hypothetical protein